MKMVLLHTLAVTCYRCYSTLKGNREHVMNAVVTRNRELLSRCGSHQFEQQMGLRGGGETRLAILFFFFRKKSDVSMAFFIDVILFTTNGPTLTGNKRYLWAASVEQAITERSLSQSQYLLPCGDHLPRLSRRSLPSWLNHINIRRRCCRP